MSYTDINTPVIEKITLPSGTSYFIADRQIRDVVQALSDTVAGGVSYIIAWDGTSAPAVANIPAGVVVKYNNTDYTGTLAANNATPGAFYLVKSSTLPTEQTLDIYQEYVPVGSSGNKTWEKVGDTKFNLADVVKNVTLDKQTDTVIGTSSTFTITQPTIKLETGATAGTGVVSLVTGITSASASGDSVTALTGLGTPTTDSVIGADSTFTVTQPTVTPALADTSGTGKVGVITAVSSTTKKLATTTVTGVSGSTTASKATAGTAQTTAKGTGTASTTNTDWIKGMSVSNGVLTFGAATLDTQSTPQYTFSNVTVPTAAASATTVATGSVTTSGSGADIVTAASGTTKYLGTTASGANVAWNSKDTVSAVTGYATPSTETVLGTGSTITVTPTTTNVKATASGANTKWNNKDSVTVLKSTTDVNITKNS